VKRRNFLKSLLALPGLALLKPEKEEPSITRAADGSLHFTEIDWEEGQVKPEFAKVYGSEKGADLFLQCFADDIRKEVYG
jgi:uncharacterized protein involved in tellurium resistance